MLAQTESHEYRSVSFVDDVKGIVQGYIAIWGSPEQTDSYGTWWDKARPPELDLDLLPVALRYEHGMDGAIRQSRIGEVFKVWFDDIGISFQAKLDKSFPHYERVVIEIKEGTINGPLRTSSGSIQYLTKFRNDGSFSVWPLGEVTLTAFASESRMPQVTIRSELQLDAVGAQTTLQTDASQEAETDDNGVIAIPVNEEETTMLEELKAVIDALPEGSDINAIMAALLGVEGIDVADLEAAVGMLTAPPAEGEGERNEMPQEQQLINALAQIVAEREQQQKTEEHAAMEEELRSLRMQNALYTAARSAPPAQQQQTGDTTGGGNITGMRDMRFDHLNSRQMGYGYKLLRANGQQPSLDYMRAMAGKTIETVERMATTLPGANDFRAANYQSLRSSIGGATRADEIVNTATAASAGNWVPGESWETQLWESIRQNLIMDNLMNDMMVIEADNRPGATTYVPLEGSDPTFYKAAENTDVGSDLQPAPLVDPSQLGAGQVAVTPLKGMARVIVSTEMIEDSIIPVLAQLDKQFNEAFQEEVEYLFLNGDTTTTASTNINLIDGTPAGGTSAPSYLITDGALKYALVTGTSTSDDGGTLTSQDFLDARGLLPNNIKSDPGKMIYISDNSTQLKALALTDWKDISVSTQPTQETGVITRAWGTPYFGSGQMALANSAGKISATAGNNTLGRLLLIVPKYWAMVWKRKVTFKTMEDIDTDTTKVVSSFRLAFQERGAGASTCIYNLTV
jgi:hypothetical protein